MYYLFSLCPLGHKVFSLCLIPPPQPSVSCRPEDRTATHSPLSTHSFMFWFHNWHPPQCIVLSVTNSRPFNLSHQVLLNKTYLAPFVSVSLFTAPEGCWACLGRCPRRSWPGCGVGHGTRPSLASRQLRLVTSSWRQARAQHQHSPYLLSSAQPRPSQSWIAKYWWNLLILKILHLKYNLAQKSIQKPTNEV